MAKRKSKLEIQINELSEVLKKSGYEIISGLDEDDVKLSISKINGDGRVVTIDKKTLIKNTEQLNEYHGFYGIEEIAETIIETFKLN